jgi:hypothetical protein
MTDAEAPLDRESSARYGRVAGLLFMTGALATVPAAFLLDPFPGAEILFVTALGVVSGVVCFWLPWERLPQWCLDALATAGTAEILLVCAVVDESYRLLYFVVAVWAAVVLTTRIRLAVQVGLILVAVTVPVIYHDDPSEQLRIALLFAPVVILVTAAVRYLGELLERRERVSREFAREAITLAIRLRRGTPGREEERHAELADLQRALERLG